MRTRVFALLLATATAAAACGGDGSGGGITPPPKPVATNLSLVDGDGQSGNVSAALTKSLSVKVTDQNAQAMAGATVTFTASAGTLGTPTATTGSDGVAATTWTLGTKVGAQTVTASVTGISKTVTFNATALAIPVLRSIDALCVDTVQVLSPTFTLHLAAGNCAGLQLLSTAQADGSTKWLLRYRSAQGTITWDDRFNSAAVIEVDLTPRSGKAFGAMAGGVAFGTQDSVFTIGSAKLSDVWTSKVVGSDIDVLGTIGTQLRSGAIGCNVSGLLASQFQSPSLLARTCPSENINGWVTASFSTAGTDLTANDVLFRIGVQNSATNPANGQSGGGFSSCFEAGNPNNTNGTFVCKVVAKK